MPGVEQDSNAIIEKLLHDRLDSIQSHLRRTWDRSPPPLDDEIKSAVEEIEDRKPRLLVILETSGDYMKTADESPASSGTTIVRWISLSQRMR